MQTCHFQKTQKVQSFWQFLQSFISKQNFFCTKVKALRQRPLQTSHKMQLLPVHWHALHEAVPNLLHSYQSTWEWHHCVPIWRPSSSALLLPRSAFRPQDAGPPVELRLTRFQSNATKESVLSVPLYRSTQQNTISYLSDSLDKISPKNAHNYCHT